MHTRTAYGSRRMCRVRMQDARRERARARREDRQTADESIMLVHCLDGFGSHIYRLRRNKSYKSEN